MSMAEVINAYKISVRKFKGERSLQRPGQRV
jgi:hypothetical protein